MTEYFVIIYATLVIFDKQKEIYRVIDRIESQIQKLKEYRQSLIYEAVTGKIDVRELVAEK